MTGPKRSDQQRRQAVVDAFTEFAAGYSELGRDFARHMGMHTSDSAAMVEILRADERGDPLTPARLGERIGLTSGATSILLNRLEAAGHIERRRGHADRRKVTLHAAAAIHAPADEFFDPVLNDWDSIMNRYTPKQLDVIADFVAEMRDAVARHHEQFDPLDQPGS